MLPVIPQGSAELVEDVLLLFPGGMFVSQEDSLNVFPL
jgi:hypothetical protein